MSYAQESLIGVSAYVTGVQGGLMPGFPGGLPVFRRTQLYQVGKREAVALQLVSLDCGGCRLQVISLRFPLLNEVLHEVLKV
jgi:hypothetical protein